MSIDTLIILISLLGGMCFVCISLSLHDQKLSEGNIRYKHFLKPLPIKEGDVVVLFGKNITFNNGLEGLYLSTVDETVTKKFYIEFTESMNKVLDKHKFTCRKFYKHRPFLTQTYNYNSKSKSELKVEINTLGCYHSSRKEIDLRDVIWSEDLFTYLTKLNLCFIISGLYADKKGLLFEFPGEVTLNKSILDKIIKGRKDGVELFKKNIDIGITKTGKNYKAKTWNKLFKKKQGVDVWFKKHHEADIVSELVFEDFKLEKHLFSEDNHDGVPSDTIIFNLKYKDDLGRKIKTNITVTTSIKQLSPEKIGFETILEDRSDEYLGFGIVVPMKLSRI